MKLVRIAPSLALIFALVLSGGEAWAEPPAQTRALGKTYGEWSGLWWQWLTSIPATTNPVSQTGTINCSLGQKGAVVFLAGTLGGTAVRSCSVPDKAIFFPLVNFVDFNSPDFSWTVAQKRENADILMSLACNLSASVDGTPTVYNVARVRAQSPAFSLLAGPDDILGRDPGALDTEAISDGIWVMLPPLSQGTHTLVFTGALCNPPGSPFFEVDVTYNLTVY